MLLFNSRSQVKLEISIILQLILYHYLYTPPKIITNSPKLFTYGPIKNALVFIANGISKKMHLKVQVQSACLFNYLIKQLPLLSSIEFKFHLSM